MGDLAAQIGASTSDIIVDASGPFQAYGEAPYRVITFAIGIALTVQDGRLHNITQCWSVFGVPLPRVLCPGGEVYEHAEDGRFNFHVDIKAPLIGRIVKYRGWLEPSS